MTWSDMHWRYSPNTILELYCGHMQSIKGLWALLHYEAPWRIISKFKGNQESYSIYGQGRTKEKQYQKTQKEIIKDDSLSSSSSSSPYKSNEDSHIVHGEENIEINTNKYKWYQKDDQE